MIGYNTVRSYVRLEKRKMLIEIWGFIIMIITMLSIFIVICMINSLLIWIIVLFFVLLEATIIKRITGKIDKRLKGLCLDKEERDFLDKVLLVHPY